MNQTNAHNPPKTTTWRQHAETGAMVGLLVAIFGCAGIFLCHLLWTDVGVMHVIFTGGSDAVISKVQSQQQSALDLWPLVALSAVAIGVAVWIMEAVTARLGPPFAD